MTLTPEDLKYLEPEFQKLAELEEKASTAPWRAEYSHDMNDYENEDWVLYSEDGNLCSGNYYSTPGIDDEKDALLITEARNQLKPLLTALAAERKRVAELEPLLTRVVEWQDKYPPERVYSEYTIIRIADEMTQIVNEAREALTKTKGRVD